MTCPFEGQPDSLWRWRLTVVRVTNRIFRAAGVAAPWREHLRLLWTHDATCAGCGEPVRFRWGRWIHTEEQQSGRSRKGER